MGLPKFEYVAAKSVAEACRLLREAGGEARVMAGGTDLLVKLKAAASEALPRGTDAFNGAAPGGARSPRLVIGLRGIQELAVLAVTPGVGLTIGATAYLADVASHPDVRRLYPAVSYAAAETGTPQVRNMGTVVGNLCNAAPSADNAPALLALDAELRLATKETEGTMPLSQFFRGPGETALRLGEIVTSVVVPEPPTRSGMSYRHLSARGRVDLSAVGAAALVALDEGGRVRTARIALGGVAPTPLLVPEAAGLLVGVVPAAHIVAAAVAAAAEAARPISDVRASAGYRRRMVRTLVERALADAIGRASAGKEVGS